MSLYIPRTSSPVTTASLSIAFQAIPRYHVLRLHLSDWSLRLSELKAYSCFFCLCSRTFIILCAALHRDRCRAGVDCASGEVIDNHRLASGIQRGAGDADALCAGDGAVAFLYLPSFAETTKKRNNILLSVLCSKHGKRLHAIIAE